MSRTGETTHDPNEKHYGSLIHRQGLEYLGKWEGYVMLPFTEEQMGALMDTITGDGHLHKSSLDEDIAGIVREAMIRLVIKKLGRWELVDGTLQLQA